MNLRNIFVAGLVVASIGFTSCESDDTSKRNPIEHLRETQAKVKNELVSSEYGWVINFFPSEDSYGGYYLYMDFSEDWSVDVRSDLRTEDLAISSEEYNFTMLNSFALNFPVQGKIHQFIALDPSSHRTDIEFLFDKFDGEDLLFKGHTTGHSVRFRKATQELKNDYMKHQETRTLFNTMKRVMVLNNNDSKILGFNPVANSDGRMFNLSEKGMFADSQAVGFGVSCGSDLLTISQPFIVDGVEISEFRIENNQFVAEKDGVTILITK